jgi:hypothetical protein
MIGTVKVPGKSMPFERIGQPDSRRPRASVVRAFIFAVFLAALSLDGAGAQTADKRGPLLPSPQERVSSAEGSYYALVIGINDYPAPMKKLKTAVGDASAVGKMLHDRYGFQVTYLLDDDATRAKILEALHKYRNTLGENDSLVIYYAGHGFSDRDADKAYWLPVDADSGDSVNRIIADDLTSDVKVLPARHVLIISDSCYSGGLSRDADTPENGGTEPAYIARMLKARSRTLLSSGGDEPVADNGQDGHSVFAYALLQAFERTDKPVFTASDLFYSSVRQQVAGRSEQLPQYAIIRNSNSDEGDFVFRVNSSPDADRRLRVASDVARGKTLYYSYRATEALPLFTRACDDGDPQGCRFAGGTYVFGGDGIEVNATLGGQYLSRGCEGGVMRACANLGSLYAQGNGVTQDRAKAFALYSKACAAGDSVGCGDLGQAYENGDAVGKDAGRAKEFYAREDSILHSACDGGDLIECMNLGVQYGAGRGVAEDDAQAVSYFRKACDGGSPDGCERLGNSYFNGQGIDKNYRSAADFYKRSCDGGDSSACNSLANAYQSGDGVHVDKAQAAALFKQSCDRGNGVACTDLGVAYREGDGVSKDESRANELYLKACDAGEVEACSNLGVIYDKALGVRQDSARAVDFFQKACGHDSGRGCQLLGEAYQAGKGVPQSDEQAVSFFRKACDNDSAKGCGDLGTAYSTGKGIGKDDVQAGALFRKACDGGDSDVCDKAASAKSADSKSASSDDFFQKFFGVNASATPSTQRTECDAGSFSSCYSLGLDYDLGLGVDNDPKLAAKYYQQACDGGIETACDALKKQKP